MSGVFAPADGPRVFALPPGADFAARLLDGLDARLAGRDPALMARTEILLNTERARRRLLALIEARPVRLVPRIRVLTELGEGAADPAAPLRRRLELARLVRALIASAPELGDPSGAFDLAESLATLLGEMQEEGVAFADLEAIDLADLAGHWQRSLSFLALLRDYLEADGADAAARWRRAMLAQAAAWTAAPPAHPVLIAGSTGSRGPTPELMAAAARLPAGAVILPGLDTALPRTVWDRLAAGDGGPEHPQWGFARLGRRVGFDPAEVPLWQGAGPPAPARAALLSLALRPAPVTDQWRAEGPALAPTLGAATEGLALVEAPGPREEAEAIALALREAVAEGCRAALVTPDRTLARRVTAELDRWGILPDDSAGRPLGLTPPGILLRLALDLDGTETPAPALAALLAHPLAASTPGARPGHRAHARDFELEMLRRAGGRPTRESLAAWGARAEGRGPWAEWLAGLLFDAPLPGAAPFATHLEAHIARAERIAAGPGADGAGALWQEEAGAAAAALAAELRAAAPAGGEMTRAEYRGAITAILGGRDVPRAAYTPDPRVAIWGTIEARIQSADLTILGGLAEGVWPKQPAPDPWLSGGIRAALGLPVIDRQIGLSAHDFQQAAATPRAILTRSLRDAEAPTVATRWLLRLENLLRGLGPEGEAAHGAMKARGDALLARAARLARPAAPVPKAPRPAPAPPAEARPDRLSATRIATLVRDPYAIYAAHVLRLRPLDPLGREPDHRERGTAFHDALEAFVDATRAGLQADAAALFDRIVAERLAVSVPWPAARALWRARLAAFAPRFLSDEAARRARGTPAALEGKGRMTLDLPGPFTLEARADRIDRAPDGSLAIYDYKTSPPTAKQLRVFDRQLQIEALIAEAGGFAGLEPGPVRHLEMIRIAASGTNPAIDDVPAAIAETRADLLRLLAAYRDPATPFPARTRPERIDFAGDHDRLARRGEWEDGADYAAEPVG